MSQHPDVDMPNLQQRLQQLQAEVERQAQRLSQLERVVQLGESADGALAASGGSQLPLQIPE